MKIKSFFTAIISLSLITHVCGQQLLPDSGFTNKSEAQNELSGGLKEGKWIENIDLKGNVTTGKDIHYYRLTIYKADKPVGIQWYYYMNNKLAAEMPYVDGKKNGTGKLYYESGKFLKAIPYSEGLINGTCKLYYESGALMSEISFTKGKKNGLGRLYYETGKVKSETYYTDDLKNGAVKVY